MANQGKRLIPEDDLEYLQELKEAHSDPHAEWGGGGGSTYEAGEGITIEDETISANIKAGYGIVVDVDLSDESLVIMTDDEHIQDKLVAGTGIDINATNHTISIDNSVAMKTDIPELDNETIILDTETNKYKTVIGGSKETVEDYLDDVTLSYSSSSYNITDSTIANNIYNTLDVNFEYPVSITLIDTTATKTIISAYIKASSKTTTRFGGASTLYATDSDGVSHAYEFYADKNSNKVNIWFNDGFATNGSLKLEFLPYEKWNKINIKAIPDITGIVNIGAGLMLDTDNKIKVYMEAQSPTYVSQVGNTLRSGFNYEENDFNIMPNDGLHPSYIANELRLTDGISGRYNSYKLLELNSDYTVSGNNTTITNSLMNIIFAKTILSKSSPNNVFFAWYAGANLGTSSSVNFGSCTKVDNTYTYNNNNVSFGFTLNNDDSITIDTQATIKNSSILASSSAIVFYNLIKLDELVVPMDAKFVPIDNSTITIDGNGKLTASGGSSKYLHKVKIYFNISGTSLYFEDVFSSSSSTPYTSVDTFLTDRGYTVSSNTDQPTKRLETYATSAITALAYRTDQSAIATSTVSISSSGVQTCSSWSVESNTPVIIDEVM